MRDKAKGSGAKSDFGAVKGATVYGTSDGFVVVNMPKVKISDPSLPDYGYVDRKPLFVVVGMLHAPYSQSIQTIQLLGMAEKSFWDGLSDFFTIFE